MRPPLGCVVLAFACATAQHPVERPRPEARSSVDAVLMHGGDLGLTEAQREKLSSIAEHEREQVRVLRTEVRSEVPVRHGGGRRGGDPMFVGGGRGQADARRARRYRIDELDNSAFLEAESALDEAQRPKAREIASKYRAELFDYRQQRSEQGEQGDGDAERTQQQ